MAKTGVPGWALYPLGTVKATGVLGLLVGIVVPRIGTAAAGGLTPFFIGAIITNLLAGEFNILLTVVLLVLAAASLVLGLARTRHVASS